MRPSSTSNSMPQCPAQLRQNDLTVLMVMIADSEALLDLNPKSGRQSRNGVRIPELRREIVGAGNVVAVGNVLPPQRDSRVPGGNLLSDAGVEQPVTVLNRKRRGIRVVVVRLIVHCAAIREIDRRVQGA